MGSSTSRKDSVELSLANLPAGEVYIGLENFGSTCYCNSILQALYACVPFRQALLQYHAAYSSTGSVPATPASATSIANSPSPPSSPSNLLDSLARLFSSIATFPNRTGVLAPQDFIRVLRRGNALFRTPDHHDAHEFLQYTLNTVEENITKERADRAKASCIERNCLCPGCGICCTGTAALAAPDCKRPNLAPTTATATAISPSDSSMPSDSASPLLCCCCSGGAMVRRRHRPSGAANAVRRPPHCTRCDCPDASPSRWRPPGTSLFSSVVAAVTECLNCNTQSVRTERHLDLSVEVAPNTSLYACLAGFASEEVLRCADKFRCTTCNAKQEAARSLRLVKAPHVLAVQLKRFRYSDASGRLVKVSDRVSFPTTVALPPSLPLSSILSATGLSSVEVEAAVRASAESFAAATRTLAQQQQHQGPGHQPAPPSAEDASHFVADGGALLSFGGRVLWPLRPPPSLTSLGPPGAPSQPRDRDTGLGKRASKDGLGTSVNAKTDTGCVDPDMEFFAESVLPTAASAAHPAATKAAPSALDVPVTEEPIPLTLAGAGGLYHLFAAVVHLGHGGQQGHYITVARSGNFWLHYDDHDVVTVRTADLQSLFGVSGDPVSSPRTAYVLFYSLDNPSDWFR